MPPPANLKCFDCDVRCSLENELTDHCSGERHRRRWLCIPCLAPFSSQLDFLRHCREVDVPAHRYCSLCNILFSTLPLYQAHHHRNHVIAPPSLPEHQAIEAQSEVSSQGLGEEPLVEGTTEAEVLTDEQTAEEDHMVVGKEFVVWEATVSGVSPRVSLKRRDLELKGPSGRGDLKQGERQGGGRQGQLVEQGGRDLMEDRLDSPAELVGEATAVGPLEDAEPRAPLDELQHPVPVICALLHSKENDDTPSPSNSASNESTVKLPLPQQELASIEIRAIVAAGFRVNPSTGLATAEAAGQGDSRTVQEEPRGERAHTRVCAQCNCHFRATELFDLHNARYHSGRVKAPSSGANLTTKRRAKKRKTAKKATLPSAESTGGVRINTRDLAYNIPPTLPVRSLAQAPKENNERVTGTHCPICQIVLKSKHRFKVNSGSYTDFCIASSSYAKQCFELELRHLEMRKRQAEERERRDKKLWEHIRRELEKLRGVWAENARLRHLLAARKREEKLAKKSSQQGFKPVHERREVHSKEQQAFCPGCNITFVTEGLGYEHQAEYRSLGLKHEPLFAYPPHSWSWRLKRARAIHPPVHIRPRYLALTPALLSKAPAADRIAARIAVMAFSFESRAFPAEPCASSDTLLNSTAFIVARGGLASDHEDGPEMDALHTRHCSMCNVYFDSAYRAQTHKFKAHVCLETEEKVREMVLFTYQIRNERVEMLKRDIALAEQEELEQLQRSLDREASEGRQQQERQEALARMIGEKNTEQEKRDDDVPKETKGKKGKQPNGGCSQQRGGEAAKRNPKNVHGRKKGPPIQIIAIIPAGRIPLSGAGPATGMPPAGQVPLADARLGLSTFCPICRISLRTTARSEKHKRKVHKDFENELALAERVRQAKEEKRMHRRIEEQRRIEQKARKSQGKNEGKKTSKSDANSKETLTACCTDCGVYVQRAWNSVKP
ncbi:hypothetical protein NMY22_g19217 [Coprinellus aureogranulatus]|nr:hypothetical protein NMY22_g19217 [Coprinellus aureogranulatus]